MADGTQIRITAVDATTAAFRSVQANISGLQGSLRNIAGPLAAAFSVAGIAAFAKKVIDLGDRLNDVSKQTGISVESLSALGNAAKLNGADTETLNTGLVKLNRAIAEASSGAEEQKKAFEALGITQEELKNKSPLEIFYRVSDAFANAADGAGKTDVAMKLLGRSGAELIPLLNEGSDALKKFGATFTTEQAQRFDEFNDNITKLGSNLQKLAVNILGPVIKGVNSFFKSLEDGNARLRADTKDTFGTFDMFMGDFQQQIENSKNVIDEAKKDIAKPIKPQIQLEDIEETKRLTEKLTERNKELVDIYNKTRQPVDILADGLARLDQLYSAGYISLSQYLDAQMQLQEAFQNTQPKIDVNDTALKKYSATVKDVQSSLQTAAVNGLRSLEDALVGVYTGTLTVKDAFRNMAVSIIQDLIRIQVQRSITGPLSDALSSLFSASNTGPEQLAGPRALGGTAQMGEAYMVGEKGPELFIPGKTGVVVPNDQLGGSGGVINQTINISTGVSQTVRAEVMGMLPRIMEATKAAVADSKRRGGTFGKMMA